MIFSLSSEMFPAPAAPPRLLSDQSPAVQRQQDTAEFALTSPLTDTVSAPNYPGFRTRRISSARAHVARIKAQITAGTFCFADEFPRYLGLDKLPRALQHRTFGEVFDEFLRHEAARLARGDLAAATVSSHRKIFHHVWRPHLAEVPFLGVRYSMLIKIADAYPCNKKTYNNAVSEVLQLASTIWNAVVYDTIHGNTEWVTRLGDLIAGQPPLVALIEQMIPRKRSSFGHDLRLIGEFKILEKNGEWRLRAEARAPTAP